MSMDIAERIGISTHFMPAVNDEDIFEAMNRVRAAGFGAFEIVPSNDKGRIIEVHMNGVNHYWGKFMEHQPVHLNNAIDYQATFERLKADDYRGPIICEIQGNDLEQVIEHCQEAKEMIVGIWNGTRKLKRRWNVPE